MDKSLEDNKTGIIKNLSQEDFDGHTEFNRLTPEQKLAWLSQAVQFYYACGGISSGK
jgi:hypothetical protein